MDTCLSTHRNIPAELQLITLALNVTKNQQQKLKKFLSENKIDWDLFIKSVVVQHRVTGPVYRSFAQYANASVPDFVLSYLQKQHKKNGYGMLTKTAELLKLADLFKTNKIRALPFKGPVLGVQLYDDFCMRLSSDLDIITAPEDFSRAENILLNSGYKKIQPPHELSKKQYKAFFRQSAHFIFLNPKRNVQVELHRIFFLERMVSLNFDEIWQNRKMVKIGEKHVPSCPLEEILIPLLIHGAKHSWKRLFWLNDILLIVKNYTEHDWKKLIEKIEDLGITRPALSSLVLLNALFNVTLPDKIHAMIKHDKKIIFLAQMSLMNIIRTDEVHPGTNSTFLDYRLLFANLFLVSNMRYKINFISALFSPRIYDFQYFPVPDKLFFLHYPLLPFAWFFRKFTNIKPGRIPKNPNNQKDSFLNIKSPSCS